METAAFLQLEDGSIFPGKAFGAKKSIPGEVGMCITLLIKFTKERVFVLKENKYL